MTYETPSIDPRMIRARAALITSQPFYATLALHLEIVEAPQYDTMATDGRRLFYNPLFLDEIDGAMTEFVIAHEVAHCANLHHTRRNGRDHERWNIACDYVINLDLVKAGFRMPPDLYLDQRFDGLGAEDVYRILEQEEQQQQQQQGDAPQDDDASGDQGEPEPGDDQADDGDQSGGDQSGDDAGDQGGAGGGAGEDESEGDGGESGEGDAQGGGSGGSGRGVSDPRAVGEILDAAASAAEMGEQEAEWQTITRQAVAVAARAAGGMPDHLQRLVADLKKPKQDWREILRRFVDPSTRFDYSWSRPDRRFGTADFILPGMVSDGVNHIAIAVDTSGSIDLKALERFRAELQAAIDDGAVDHLTVIYCDSTVQRVDTFENGEPVKFDAPGGGGTLFQPVYDWLLDKATDATALVYFTDLMPNGNDFGREPHLPVLWACFGDPRWLKGQMQKVPFGECIELAD